MSSCEHLTVSHDADNCTTCLQKRRRKQKSNHNTSAATSLYANQAYWQQRYATTTHSAGSGRNEWFVSFQSLQHILCQYPIHQNALEIGCGMSLLSEELLTNKIVSQVTAVDFSAVAIAHMIERQHTRNQPKKNTTDASVVQYLVMDATKLKFENDSFDLVIEKGTLDALLTDESEPSKPNEPNEANEANEAGEKTQENERIDATSSTKPTPVQGQKLLSEAKRVLSKEGRFIIISHTETRKRIIAANGFQVDQYTEVTNGNASYHVYCCSHAT